MNDDLQVRIAGEDATGAAFASAQGHMTGFAADIAMEAAKVVAAFVSIEKAGELAFAAIHKADEVRDLALSLGVFAGSMEKGTAALKFFEEQAARTRDTTDELAKVFRDVLPLAMARGFSQDAMQQVTVMLSQLATVAGKSLDEMESSFRMLLAGRVSPGRNALLQVLGITKEDAASLGWDELLSKMQTVSKGAADFGQSWESTWKKAKDSLLEAIGGGFNEARGSASAGMNSLLAIVNSPDVQNSLRAIGRTIAEIGPPILRTFEAVGGQVRMLFGGLETAAGVFLTGLGFVFEKYFSTLARSADAMPAWVKKIILYGSGIDINASVTSAKMGASIFGDLRSAGEHLADTGADNVREGIDLLAKSMDPYATAADKATEATKKIIAPLGRVAIATATVKDELAKVKDELLEVVDVMKMFAAERARVEGITKFAADIFGAPTLEQKLSQGTFTLGAMDSSAFDDAMAEQKKMAQEYADEVAQRLHDNLVGDFATDFASLFSQGGKNFVRTMERDWNRLMADGAKTFSDYLFGTKDVVGKDSQGNDVLLQKGTPGLLQKAGLTERQAQAGLTMAEIGVGSYSAAKTNPDGSMTAGIIGGAMAGAPFGPWGMVVGAIVGAIGAELGKMAAKRDYQYGAFAITDGVAHGGSFKNISSGDQTDMIARTQQAFDDTWNAYVRAMMKIPGGSIPGISDGSSIRNDKQTSPYASFMSDFNLWLSQTLPDEIAGKFKGGLQRATESIGLTATQFDAIWKKWDALDPKKTVQMWTDLIDVLTTVNTATSFFGAGTPKGGINTSYFSGVMSLTGEGNKSFTDKLGESDAKILDLASNLKNLTGEGQIAAAKELAGLMQNRYDLERQYIQSIIDMTKAAHDAAMRMREDLTLMGMVGADGKPDYAQQANYLKTKADEDLRGMYASKDPAVAKQLYDDYLATISKIVNLGYQINPKTGEDYRRWALDQITLGETAFSHMMDQFGKTMSNANAAFLEKFTPLFDGFKSAIGGIVTTISPGGPGDIGPPIEVIVEKFGQLGDSVDALIVRLNAATLNNSTFAQRTAAAR